MATILLTKDCKSNFLKKQHIKQEHNLEKHLGKTLGSKLINTILQLGKLCDINNIKSKNSSLNVPNLKSKLCESLVPTLTNMTLSTELTPGFNDARVL